MRLWPFGAKEEREVKFSPEFSVYLANRSLGIQSQSSVAVNSETAMRFMAVFSCIRVISEDIASLPLPLYRRLTPRGKERVQDHPMYEVLHSRPNPEQTSFQWRETLQTHLLLWGNAFCEIVRENGWPAELWPIHPTRITIRRNRQTQELEYLVTPPGESLQRVFTGNQVFHLAGLSINGVQGVSPIAVGRDAIGLGLASQEFASSFFARGARPSAVLEHPGQLSPEAHERLKSDFEAANAGLSNAQRVTLLEEGMKLNATYQMPLEDAQFIENRKMSIEEIARLFRVQPFKIGDHTHSTFSNVEHLSVEHVHSTIRPWLVRWEQAILNQLIPEEERAEIFAEFLAEGLLRGDSKARADFYQAMWGLGVFSPNDIRELENMNPIEDGDTYYVPLNYGPVGAEMEPEEPDFEPQMSQNGNRRAKIAAS